jgi:plasmid maintenance system antidote protein VapI
MIADKSEAKLSERLEESNRRIARIDKQLASLSDELAKLSVAKGVSPQWWVETAGRFANDPVFDEIVKQGRLAREAERTKKRRGKSRARS